MATEPKRKDPTEAALSAIEEALGLDATPGRQARREEEGEPRLPDVAESRPLSEAPRRPLEGEGIVFVGGRVDLQRYGWPSRDEHLDELLWKLPD